MKDSDNLEFITTGQELLGVTLHDQQGLSRELPYYTVYKNSLVHTHANHHSEQVSYMQGNGGSYPYPSKYHTTTEYLASYENNIPQPPKIDLLSAIGPILVGLILLALRPKWRSIQAQRTQKISTLEALGLLIWTTLLTVAVSVLWHWIRMTYL